MNSRKLYKELGFYQQSFFRLHIRTDNSISDINELSDLDFSTFLHEYIHFIQDITTIYGLNNIHATADYLRYANNFIISQNKTNFNVPILPDPNNQDSVLLNRELIRITFGDTIEVEKVKKIISYNISPFTIKIPNTEISEIEVVQVKCNDLFGENYNFSFGAFCIMESMAYLFEKQTCKKYEKSPDIPYNIAELIVEYIYPEFGKDKLNIIALCDISLNLSNPGKYFIQTIEYLKSNNFVPSRPEDLYDNFYKDKLSTTNKVTSDFKTQFLNFTILAKYQLMGYFNDPVFDNIKEWIDEVIKIAVEYRLKKQTFILDFARGNIRENKNFIDFFNKLGTPLLTNDNNDYQFYHSISNSKRIDIGYFWAISQIHEIFFGTKVACGLINFCNQKDSVINTDLRCSVEPWSRSNDMRHCAFSLIWRHWKLLNYKPVF